MFAFYHTTDILDTSCNTCCFIHLLCMHVCSFGLQMGYLQAEKKIIAIIIYLLEY